MLRDRGWRFRCPSYFGMVTALSAAGSFLLIFINAIRIVIDSEHHPVAAIIVGSNYVSWIVIAALILLLSIITGKLKLKIPIPVTLCAAGIGDTRRSVLSPVELQKKFQVDGSCEHYFEDGWDMRANGVEPISAAIYRPNINNSFCIAAQFRPVVAASTVGYWRTGFVLMTNREEIACFHIDDQNLIVSRCKGGRELKILASDTLSNRWSFLELQISKVWNSNSISIFGAYCGRNYFIGETPLPQELRAHVHAWSDQRRCHCVYLRDISVVLHG